jgi:preprotein translocase subunit SecE
MASLNPLKYLQEVRQEVNKVTWPTRNEVLISTLMVLILVALASLFFLGADWIISTLVQWALSIRA